MRDKLMRKQVWPLCASLQAFNAWGRCGNFLTMWRLTWRWRRERMWPLFFKRKLERGAKESRGYSKKGQKKDPKVLFYEENG